MRLSAAVQPKSERRLARFSARPPEITPSATSRLAITPTTTATSRSAALASCRGVPWPTSLRITTRSAPSEACEEHREELEQRLRDGLLIPEHTVAIAVSLDGVLAPIDGGAHSARGLRAEATGRDELSKWPAGYREVGCATVSFCARPELRLTKVADGAADNWTFLSGALPAGDEAIDFFRASEHLHGAIAAAYGDGTRET